MNCIQLEGLYISLFFFKLSCVELSKWRYSHISSFFVSL